ncbi:MAG: hypothetical protein QOG87_3781 [Actinomycetota bacterium]
MAFEQQGTDVTLVAVDDPLPDADLVVVDSYRAMPDRSQIGSAVLAAVDDLGRDLAIDALIDPAPNADPEDHPSADVVLAGADYALLGPDSVEAPAADHEVKVVLVSAGATDSEGHAAAVANELHLRLPGVRIRLVVGPWGSDAAPQGIELVQAPSGLGPELHAASLVVTAAGVTMLESMRAGRPTVAFLTAENQRRQADGAAELGGIVLTDVSGAADAAVTLAGDTPARLALAARAATLIDGQGPARVAHRLLELAEAANR